MIYPTVTPDTEIFDQIEVMVCFSAMAEEDGEESTHRLVNHNGEYVCTHCGYSGNEIREALDVYRAQDRHLEDDLSKAEKVYCTAMRDSAQNVLMGKVSR